MFSDLPPKADIDRRDGYVCFVPEAAVSRCSREPLLDHLVGTLLEKERHVEAERPGGLEVDHQLELDRGLDGKIARLRALEDAIGVDRRAPKIIDQVISIGQQAADCSELTGLLDGTVLTYHPPG